MSNQKKKVNELKEARKTTAWLGNVCISVRFNFLSPKVFTRIIHVHTGSSDSAYARPHPPVLHTVGLPALGQLQGTDSRLASRGDVVVTGVSIVIPTEPTHLVLQPLAHGDAQRVEAVVANLDVLGCVDDDEAL